MLYFKDGTTYKFLHSIISAGLLYWTIGISAEFFRCATRDIVFTIGTYGHAGGIFCNVLLREDGIDAEVPAGAASKTTISEAGLAGESHIYCFLFLW